MVTNAAIRKLIAGYGSKALAQECANGAFELIGCDDRSALAMYRSLFGRLVVPPQSRGLGLRWTFVQVEGSHLEPPSNPGDNFARQRDIASKPVDAETCRMNNDICVVRWKPFGRTAGDDFSAPPFSSSWAGVLLSGLPVP